MKIFFYNEKSKILLFLVHIRNLCKKKLKKKYIQIPSLDII